MQGTCVILVHNDSPGIWKLPGALWQLLRVPDIFWGFVTIPGIAWPLQGPVALFFMASERRICRLIVGKPFGEKETAWKGLYLEAHLQGLTRQQGDVAGSPLPPEAWGSQGVWIPYGLFPSGKLKISHSGRSAGSTCPYLQACDLERTKDAPVAWIRRYRSSEPSEQVHRAGAGGCGCPRGGWHTSTYRHQH